MLESFFYALLAIFGLGFLVFIHELGHYWVARRKKMRVEVFAIGFGRPIYSWQWGGVKWQIGCLPFGGYVKIAGMQKEKGKEPYEIPDGFYGKSPWDRIQVAFAGPLANLAFALVAFSLIWVTGGREKNFSEFTHRIGWIAPGSPLDQLGLQPGDVIVRCDGKPFRGFKDLWVSALMDKKKTRLQGYRINYMTGHQREFDETFQWTGTPSPSQSDAKNTPKEDPLLTMSSLLPAQYLLYDPKEGSPFSGSPIEQSGILPNDRLLWVDGDVIFSAKQLSAIINESSALITVRRGEEVFQTKVPRVLLRDLKMSAVEQWEIDDWQHEAGLEGKSSDLFLIPYNLSPEGIVEGQFHFLDEEEETKVFAACRRSASFHPLEEGDRILAVNGTRVHSSYELLAQLQRRRVLLIIERSPAVSEKLLWTQADAAFDAFDAEDLRTLVSSLGMAFPLEERGHLYALKQIIPERLLDLPLPEEQKAKLVREFAETKKEVEAIQDPERRSEQLRALERSQKKLVLGIPLVDREVVYNPNPMELFANAFQDTWKTLVGLVSGVLKPKYVSGPVGIIHVVHHSWMIGVKEALFWLGVISLNLGIINLLPIPVLDGGHILFSLVETVTRRPLRAKTMERLIFPFVGILIALFIYITYQDITRLFSKFF